VIKIVGPMTRRDLMPQAEFDDYYVNVHVHKAKHLPGLVKYVGSICLRSANGDAPAFDAIAENYWESAESISSIYQGGIWDEVRKDHPNMISGRTMFIAEEHELFNQVPAGSSPIRYVALLTRKDAMPVDAFRKHWFEQHVPLALKTPGLLRYRACPGLASPNHGESPAWDGMVEMWFESVAAFDSSFREPYWDVLREDYYHNFANGRLQFLTREHLVLDRTGSSD
jgi:uncharacterized protein (TIGR02118 family)